MSQNSSLLVLTPLLSHLRKASLNARQHFQKRGLSGLDAGLDAQLPQDKPCFVDDLMAAIELQRQQDHPKAAEKELNRRIYNDKHRADEV